MNRLWQVYLRPRNLSEALLALQESPRPVCVMAGGSDLMLDLQQGRQEPVHTLVDLAAVHEMNIFETREDGLYLGAAIPLSKLYEHELVQEHAQALVEACRLIGGPQVRNVATLGGNVAHALPAADGTIALMCLDVQAQVAETSGIRWVPFESLFLGPGRSALQAGREILVGFRLPLRSSGQASAFRRVMRTQGIALPILNVSVWLERQDDAIGRVRLAAGPSGPVPRRLVAVETSLAGRKPGQETVAMALGILLSEASFRTSPHRASREYRQHLVGALLEETLACAWERTFNR